MNDLFAYLFALSVLFVALWIVYEICMAVRRWNNKRDWFISSSPRPDERSSIELARRLGGSKS